MMIIAGCLILIGAMMNSNKKSNAGILLTVLGVAFAFGLVLFK